MRTIHLLSRRYGAGPIKAITILTLITAVDNIGIAAEAEKNYKFENKLIKFALFPRTPEQMAAFYEGRDFPKKAINVIRNACFITAGIRNLGNQKIWLNLIQWRFYSTEDEITRINRQKWVQDWQRLDIPLASQATFGWTLLPETRDLHQHEPVGGNITLLPSEHPFTVEAIFETGEQKNGKPLTVKIENVRCAQNKENTP
ncbi:MAG: hypothetical protein GXP08_06890 [Gammaproteobacteria bacterium]|nr:hypothetical protein [Gammaproteobacteria bacterium]